MNHSFNIKLFLFFLYWIIDIVFFSAMICAIFVMHAKKSGAKG